MTLIQEITEYEKRKIYYEFYMLQSNINKILMSDDREEFIKESFSATGRLYDLICAMSEIKNFDFIICNSMEVKEGKNHYEKTY